MSLPKPNPARHAPAESPKDDLRSRLIELMLVCLKIGATSFGSPTAHIAMMENEFVRKRHWLSEEHFLDLLGAANIIPGPNASETCFHVGYIRAGYPGLFVAGFSFITPAIVTSILLAWAYVRFGGLPSFEGVFYFLNPLVLAIVLDSTWRIGKGSLAGWKALLIFGLALLAKYFNVNEIIILLGSGVVGILLYGGFNLKKLPSQMLYAFIPLPLFSRLLQEAVSWWQTRTAQIFFYFLRTGSVLFGSSFVLFGLIEKDVTQRFGWLTVQQLTDSIAAGQITPGPVISSSTFIGYLAGGVPGSLAATAGVFLPSFIIVAATAPIVNKLRESALARGFLNGVNAAVVALILAVAYTLAINSIVDIWTGVLLVAGVFLLSRFDLTPYWLVLAGLALGFIKIFLIA